jgi:ATP-dependent Clp protease protease subunit
MGAIAIHHTAVDTESVWDGPAEVAAATNDSKVLRYMHAWVEDGADADLKSSYKLPHHASGSDTAANIRGVNNALARLPQTNIPEGDKSGAEKHLRAHRTDAGLEDRMSEQEINDAVETIAKKDDLTAKERRGMMREVKRQEELADDGRRTMDHKSKHEPMRCFDGNARPHEAFWKFRNEASQPEPELELYGVLSEFSWFEDDVTPKMFKTDLYNNGKGGPIKVRINSWGGDVVAASVMRAILADYPGQITVQVDGVAASAAVIVAIAGDKILVQDSAYMMIHDPSVAFLFASLDIQALKALTGELETVRDGIVAAYAERTGLAPVKLQHMMADETWMTAAEAVALGFADEIVTAGKQAARTPPGAIENISYTNLIKNYSHVPAALLAIQQPKTDVVQPVDLNEQRRQFEQLRLVVQKYR